MRGSGEHIMGQLTSLDKSNRTTTPFHHVVQGMSAYEVCRIFSATLHLVRIYIYIYIYKSICPFFESFIEIYIYALGKRWCGRALSLERNGLVVTCTDIVNRSFPIRTIYIYIYTTATFTFRMIAFIVYSVIYEDTCLVLFYPSIYIYI